MNTYTNSPQNRILSALLAIIMLMSVMPLSVFTADDHSAKGAVSDTVTPPDSNAADGDVAEVTVGNSTTSYGNLASAFTAVDIMTGKVNVTIARGLKCVKTDDQSTAYAYDNTDGTSVTITKCTEHKWLYADITDDTHDRTCDLCGTTETGVVHTIICYLHAYDMYIKCDGKHPREYSGYLQKSIAYSERFVNNYVRLSEITDNRREARSLMDQAISNVETVWNEEQLNKVPKAVFLEYDNYRGFDL